MSMVDDEAIAEARLEADIQAIDVSNPDYSSPRANAFQAMQSGWNAWPSDDTRWWAVGEILTSLALDPACERDTSTKAKRDGLEACAIAANLIGAGAGRATANDECQMRQLEAAVARLTAITAQIRLSECVDPDNNEARVAVLNA
jgi:hypothetical protein